MQVHKGILILIIIIVCLFSYFNTLFAGFVWDDNIFITPNPFMKSFRYLPKFFIQDFWKIGLASVTSQYYRPLLAASFMLDYAIWHDNPFGYHLTNLLFHISVCILIFLFIQLLTKDRLIAFASALLFSVHPVHTEAVSFVSGRVDVVPMAFFLLSLIFFLKFSSAKKIIFYLCSLVCFFISLLTKEMAVMLPFVVLCVDYFFLSECSIKNVIKNFLRFHVWFFVVLGIYLAMRFYFVGLPFGLEESTRTIKNFYIGTSPFWRPLTVIKILTFYIGLLFFPYNLKVDYLFGASNSLFEPVVIAGLAIILFLIFLAFKNARRHPILSFSILWFFITILPVSNIFHQGNIFAERYVYIPSLGYCIAMGFLLSWLGKINIKTNSLDYRKSLYIVFFLVILALARVTFERNKAWNNDFALWYDAAKKSPQSPQAHANLAHAYFTKDFFDEAIAETKKAIELNPRFQHAFLQLGNIYISKGLLDESLSNFKKALEIGPDKPEIYHQLSIVYGMKGQFKEAIEANLKALKMNPYSNATHYNLAIDYKTAGLIDKAIQAYEDYLNAEPNYPGIHVDVGYLYYQKGDYQKAKSHWLTALKISKDYQPAKDALKLPEK